MTRVARRALSALTASALLAGLLLGAPASARAAETVYVGHQINEYAPGSACASPGYWTDGDWTGGGEYDSDNDAIQDAGDNAVSGSVIYICAGTYNFAEVVTVSAGKNLTFRGEGDETALDGNDITRIFNASPVNASDQGGVLSLRDLLIMDAEVTEWNAGAVVADGLSLDNVTITRTQGAYNGGALYAEGNVTIVDSTFTDNIASADGGVLYAWNVNRTVSISNSVFDGNFAGLSGGAILATTVAVTNSTFIDNDAVYGGAILAATVAVTNSTFTNNNASGSGGAISAITVAVTNSTFTNNQASNCAGAIYVDGTATVTNSTFSGNSSGCGGAIYSYDTATVTNSTFTNNDAVAGGAIYAEVTATVTNSTFTNNEASYSGGAIAASTGTVTVSNSSFTGNTAAYWGGALYASTATIARSRFTRNTAGQHGGAVILFFPTNDDLRKLRRNTFSRNTAPSGGALTLGSCVAPSRSQAARVQRANRFSGNRATEQRRTRNIERWAGNCI